MIKSHSRTRSAQRGRSGGAIESLQTEKAPGNRDLDPNAGQSLPRISWHLETSGARGHGGTRSRQRWSRRCRKCAVHSLATNAVNYLTYWRRRDAELTFHGCSLDALWTLSAREPGCVAHPFAPVCRDPNSPALSLFLVRQCRGFHATPNRFSIGQTGGFFSQGAQSRRQGAGAKEFRGASNSRFKYERSHPMEGMAFALLVLHACPRSRFYVRRRDCLTSL
jgi:hypothetical protein